VNQFTEIYMTEKRQNVRLREVPSLMIESLVFKKKKECEREDEEGGIHKGL
jgi:hypothetical protein